MEGKRRVLTYLVPLVAGGLLFWLLNITNPVDSGPAVILIVFILLYLIWAGVLFILLHTGVRLASKFWAQRSVNVREWRIGVRKAYYIASILAFGPVLILAMQTVGQLQIRDIILVVTLLGLAIFYVLKRSA